MLLPAIARYICLTLCLCSGVILSNVSETEPQYYAMLRTEGDALQHAMNACSKESVSATTYRICRHCNVTSAMRDSLVDFRCPECEFTLVTDYSHKRDLGVVKGNPDLSKWLGVTVKTPAFERVPFYDMVEGAPGDMTMHNFVTVALLELNRDLRAWFKSDRHALNFDKFNLALRKFRWLPKDRHNMPHEQLEKAFEGDNHLLWTSSQTICFVLHSEKILAEYIDTSDPTWVCWCKHANYIRMASASRFSWETLNELASTIIDHHEMFNQLHPHCVIPKWHYEFHASIQVLLHGNLWQHASWTGEACLQMFKRWSKRISSTNPAQKLGWMYARKVAIRKQFNVSKQISHGDILIDESALDHGSELEQMLQRDKLVQAFLLDNMAIPGVEMVVSSFKRITHLSDQIELGTHFLSDSEGKIVLAVASGFIGFANQLFIMHQMYNGATNLDEYGRCVETNSLSESIRCLNLKTEMISTVSTKRFNGNTYY